jgi:hypothetical protein
MGIFFDALDLYFQLRVMILHEIRDVFPLCMPGILHNALHVVDIEYTFVELMKKLMK